MLALLQFIGTLLSTFVTGLVTAFAVTFIRGMAKRWMFGKEEPRVQVNVQFTPAPLAPPEAGVSSGPRISTSSTPTTSRPLIEMWDSGEPDAVPSRRFSEFAHAEPDDVSKPFDASVQGSRDSPTRTRARRSTSSAATASTSTAADIEPADGGAARSSWTRCRAVAQRLIARVLAGSSSERQLYAFAVVQVAFMLIAGYRGMASHAVALEHAKYKMLSADPYSSTYQMSYMQWQHLSQQTAIGSFFSAILYTYDPIGIFVPIFRVCVRWATFALMYCVLWLFTSTWGAIALTGCVLVYSMDRGWLDVVVERLRAWPFVKTAHALFTRLVVDQARAWMRTPKKLV